MTTQNSVFAGLPGGLTLTKKLFTLAAPDTVAYTSDSTVNRTNATDEYVFTFGGAVAISGNFTAKVFLGATVVGSGKRTFAGTDGETATATPEAAALDSATIRAAIGMAAADLDTQLDAILAGAGGSGTGARTVTITVNDGTTVLQNATVRMTEGANTFTALTNASGVAVFNLDDATYTVGITKSGYTYAGTTLVVNGTETATYSMTVVSVTPPDNPDLSAIVVTCLGTDFEIEAGVTIDLRVKTLPTGSENTTFPGAKQTATSNVNGIATLYGPKNSVCQWKRGKADVWTDITIGSADQTNVTSIIGSP